MKVMSLVCPGSRGAPATVSRLRDSAWNWLRWMWNGCVSGLRLTIFHTCQLPCTAIAIVVSLNRLPTVT